MRPIITSLFLLLLASASLAGPIVPSRSFILAPKMREKADTTKGVKFLRQNGLWGNLARGYGSTDERYAWSVSFGGIIQFAEWENSSIYLQGDADVLADTYNDISFNPRTIFWTEGIMYGMRLGEKNDLHVGYIHRCKHDIDNSGNNVVGANEERTLIYGSLQGKFISRDFIPTGNFLYDAADFYAALDYYLVKQDYRIPQEFTDSGNSVEDLNFSLILSTKIHFTTIGDALLYSRVAFTFSGYNWFDNVVTDARGEFGVELKGEGTTMDVYVGIEGLKDDMTRPAPVESNYYYLGFRFIANNIGL
jgi:hypothetical protein